MCPVLFRHVYALDYTLRRQCEDQMNAALERLRKDPTMVAPSAVPDKFILVPEQFTVHDGTLSPAGLLEPLRDAIGTNSEEYSM